MPFDRPDQTHCLDAGSGFAFPSLTAYVARDPGVDSEKTKAAEREVADWRSKDRLPFPEFDPDYAADIRDTLDYPPKGGASRTPR